MIAQTTDVMTIGPAELKRLIDAGYDIDLVDVRTPAEYGEIHVPNSLNVPLDTLKPALLANIVKSDEEPIYFICRSDSRGKKACKKMIAAGYDNVVNVAGGTVAWDDLTFPVVRGKKTIALDRQVRIAAGFLILAGALLSLLHPSFLLLSGFVGAGLMYSGIADQCGMAILLSMMPWNQGKQRHDACEITR